MNIALLISYDGTAYHGWQIQNNGATIQQTLTEALERALGGKLYVSGVGRTDAGVHARRYVANFKCDRCPVPLERLPLAVNAFLPEDIAVLGAVQVSEAFDARFSCIKKEYAYYLLPSRLRDPLRSRYSHRLPYALCVADMQRGAQHFVGKQDFAAVRAMGTPVKSTVRTIYHCAVEPWDDGQVRIRVCADGFLYNMVRAIAGTLVYVGTGKLPPDAVRDILDQGNRADAGPTLPPQGLFMHRLWYDAPELAVFGLQEASKNRQES